MSGLSVQCSIYADLLNLFDLSYWLNWLVKTERIERIKPIKQMERLRADGQMQLGPVSRDIDDDE